MVEYSFRSPPARESGSEKHGIWRLETDKLEQVALDAVLPIFPGQEKELCIASLPTSDAKGEGLVYMINRIVQSPPDKPYNQDLPLMFSGLDSQSKYNLISKFESWGGYQLPLFYAMTEAVTDSILCQSVTTLDKEVRHHGIGGRFYQGLARLAKENGYKMIIGQHMHPETAAYFVHKTGRVRLGDLNQAGRKLVPAKYNHSHMDEYTTIKFLNPEDLLDYVDPERLKAYGISV